MKTPSTSPPLPSQQYLEDRRWIQRNIDALVRDHANTWIAVHRGTVLAVGADLGVVTAEAGRPIRWPGVMPACLPLIQTWIVFARIRVPIAEIAPTQETDGVRPHYLPQVWTSV